MKSINFLTVFRFVSIVNFFLSLSFLIPTLYSIYIGDGQFLSFVYPLILSASVLLISIQISPSDDINLKEAILSVCLIWLLFPGLSALSYYMGGSIPSFIDAYFESVSGFTTTGASILTEIEHLPKSVLLWRSTTHWIGGLGFVVFSLSLLPILGSGGMQLMKFEASRAVEEKIKPKVKEIARTTFAVYLVITILEVISLKLSGLSFYEAINHTFATVATGGFSTRNSSVGAFSPYIQYVITIFMILAGINFALYLLLLKKKFKIAFANEELKTYIGIIIVTGAAITAILLINGTYKNFETAFRQAYFQVASIITATGFATTDYLKWSQSTHIILIMLMLIGGSAGSTSGGIKVIRHLIFVKNLKSIFKQIIHSEVVSPVYYNKKAVPQDVVNNVLVFIITYLAIVFVATMILVFMNVDITTSFGSAVTCIGGIGPGLGTTGPAGNFSQIPNVGKILLTILMLIGRLEIFTVLVIFTKSFRNG